MKTKRIGKTDIEVSVVCMGCWPIAGDATWGPQNESDAIDAIEASLEAGVNFFDTAEGYGNGSSEELLGRVLRGHRHQVVIADKVGSDHMLRADVIDACERSLRRLQTDYIDLYQVHWPSRSVPLDETAEALLKLADQGKVRAIGVSNFGPRDLADFLAVLRPESNQIAYNLLFRAPEYELLPICAENGVGVLTYSSLAEALLTGKFTSADEVPVGRARPRHFGPARAQVRHSEAGAEAETFAAIDRLRAVAARAHVPMAQLALAWLMRQPGITSVIAGARNARQARENAAAAELELPDDLAAELADITEPVKEKLGPNLDMWQTQSRIR